MGKDHNMLSFGRYLQAIRLEKRIALDKISEKTRIGIETLQFIEKEDHNRLPAEVFVKGFLRAYAKALEVDGDEAVTRYLSSRDNIQKTIKIDEDLKNPNSKFWLRLGLSVASFIALVVFCVSIISLPEKDSPADEKKKRIEAQKDKVPMEKSTKEEIADNKKETDKEIKAETGGASFPEPKPVAPEKIEKISNANVPKKFSLKIITVKETWIKVIIDNGESKEYSLHPGDKLTLKADRRFNILVGNASGIYMLFNDKPVKIVGSDRQVVNIQLP